MVELDAAPLAEATQPLAKTEKETAQRKRGHKIGVQRVLSTVFRREDRQLGKGLVGKWLNRRLTRRRLTSNVKKQIETFDNHR